MLIKKPSQIPSSEITPEHIYLSRRQFIKSAAGLGAALAVSACQPRSGRPQAEANQPEPTAKTLFDELGDPLTPFSSITTYNNYYEFGSDKQSPAERAKNLQTSPWEIAIDGLVRTPKTFGLEDLLKKFDQQESVYRLRCVEGWSMVIPWLGFPLSDLLAEVQPLSEANFVRFETVFAPAQMPMQNIKTYPWPYQEGLRIDEAMHPLTLIATGIYGKSLLPQNGAPVRLVAPWKYGFKSIKSIVRIELVQEKPLTFWRSIDPEEYGFFANVNPGASHSRWSQSSERRIGEIARRPTLMFNGYEAQVAHLYADMDLRLDY